MLDRLAIFGVPLLAGLVVAAVLLGPGRERPVVGARVRGVLVSDTSRWAVRIETLRHYAKRYQPAPNVELRLEVSHDGRPAGWWEGTTDQDGVAEARSGASRWLGDYVELHVRSGGETLCQGETHPGPLLERQVWPELAAAKLDEPVVVSAVLPRMAAVPPFPESLRIDAVVQGRADEREGVASPPQLKLTAEGAELAPPTAPPERRCRDAGCTYRWWASVVPQALTLELSAQVVTADGRQGRWEGRLPVAMGGLWLDPRAAEAGRLAIRSATPREVAYVSLLGTSGRLWGAAVPLSADEQGFARGTATPPELSSEPLVAVLSTDSSEPIGATVAWPLHPERASLPSVRMAVLADGMPAAIAREKKRENRTRRPAFGLILAAGLFELLYLFRRNRLEKLKVTAHMRRIAAEATATDGGAAAPDEVATGALPSAVAAGDPERAREAEVGAAAAERAEAEVSAMASNIGLLWLTVLAGGVALAFFALAAVAAWG